MAATSRLPNVIGADGLPQQLQPTDALFLGAFTVANLPTGPGIKAGSLTYATNGRAQTGIVTLGAATLQAAGQGTGTLVTFNGTAWQIVGTTTTVSA